MSEQEKGVRSKDTMPALTVMWSKKEAELNDLLLSLKEEIKEVRERRRDYLNGKTLPEAIREKRNKIAALISEIKQRGNSPNQLVFDFDDVVFGDDDTMVL